MEPQMPCGGAMTSTIHASLGAGVMVSTLPCESDTEAVSFVLRTLATVKPVTAGIDTCLARSCSRVTTDASADLTAADCETGLWPDPHPASSRTLRNVIPPVRMRSARPTGSLLPPFGQGNAARKPK